MTTRFPDFGRDARGVTDIDAGLSVHEPPAALGLLENLARRLSTRKGTYLLNENWGIDLRDYLGDVTPPSVIANAIELELIQDERVQTCRAEVTVVSSEELEIDVSITTPEGVTFDFVLSATAAKGVVLVQEGA